MCILYFYVNLVKDERMSPSNHGETVTCGPN